MNARYYQPSTGRFLSQDTYSGNPYDPWTQHLYSYTGNNPTSFVDPTGHFIISFLVGLAVGALVGAAVGAGTELVADIADDGEVNRPVEDYLGAAAGGAIGGVAAAATGGSSALVTAGVMAVGGCAASAVDQTISEGTVDFGQVLADGAMSGLMGGAFKGTKNFLNKLHPEGKPLYDTSITVKLKKPEIFYETDQGTGKSRASHRYHANKTLYEELKTNAELRNRLDTKFGHDTMAHMTSGKSRFINPSKSVVWHHSVQDPGKMQLMTKADHMSVIFQPYLHPGEKGGYSLYNGKK